MAEARTCIVFPIHREELRALDRLLNIGVWKHGLSLYVSPNRDGGFSARHPELAAGKGTIKLRPQDAMRIPDAELQDLVRAALLA